MYVVVFQHIECEDLGTGALVLEKAGIDAHMVRLYNEELPPADWENAAGLIFLGGPMNVYQEDEYPYLKIENEIIKKAIRLNKPVLGLCLGAQLIAKAAGAKVYAGQGKEIGWYPVTLSSEAQAQGLLAGFPSPLSVFQWHGDTFDLPEGAVLLAGSDLFSRQAFCLQNNIYALQFHLEVDLMAIEGWLEEYKAEVAGIYTPHQIEEIRLVSRKQIDMLRGQAQIFFRRFVDLLQP